ncbi:transmembrane protein, putative (macronuclear) [Tetrahymena thermophila SB210]|uniref:Transmembrane protein, putative n=1 Tax=Tetrahymena thermophila (strain SB210) TaxID=312017 RepID=I7MKF2_TETTS|nr:transmembrane protein, putative [Tetrahymena thermophila SB210]EAR98317.1 transmembrane protein, putative [Tetrahymena thermophila SB210]|eukprot:XP_001018562.1 transmembrane protein, putative [Tetrahymena thermophila SB210]
MLHLIVLLLCHLSYIQLGKLDSTIPQPKPHLTLTCFIKLLAYIPFNVGLQLTYFQNVTKLIRDLLLFCYIIGQYYTFDYDIIYRLLGFEFFVIFALPLILEGWIANSPNFILYLLKFYSMYFPLFINQFLLHEDRMIQTIFFFAIIEVPSMAHKRQDRDLPEIKMNSYIFKLVQLPKKQIAILHCTKKQRNGTNQIQLAIACFGNSNQQNTEQEQNIVDSANVNQKKVLNDFENAVQLKIIKSIDVCANTSELNYIEKNHILVISSCSDLKIYNAQNLQLLRVVSFPRSLKRLSFINYDRYYSFLKKINTNETIVSINDSVFNTIASQHIIQYDVQPEIIKFIKYYSSCCNAEKYVYMCVPSDRLNYLIIVDVKEDYKKMSLSSNDQKNIQDKTNQEHNNIQQIEQENVQSLINLKEQQREDEEFYKNGEFQDEVIEEDYSDFTNYWENSIEIDKNIINNQSKIFNHIENRKNKQQNQKILNQTEDVNLYEYIQKNQGFNYNKSDQEKGINEYVIDCSAIKDILVHEQLLVISCSENIVFFDLNLRRIVKKISTLNFDTRVHWIRITPQYTYYLISNEIRAWIAKQSNKLNDFSIIQHFNFYDIQYILENKSKNSLYVIYNNTLYKQKIAVIDLSLYSSS